MKRLRSRPRPAPAGIGHAATRVVIGLLFAGHGFRKLSRRLGGPGLAGATTQMQALGLHPARLSASAAGLTQLTGGGLLALGLMTPLGCALVSSNMIVVMRTACAGNGPWGANGGWEYPLVLAAACAALAEHGGGPVSLDRHLGLERGGPLWGLASAGAALSGAAAVLSRRTPPVGG